MFQDLQGPQHPAPVVHPQARGGLGVAGFQARVQSRHPQTASFGLEAPAEGRVWGRGIGESLPESPQVQARAGHDERQVSPSADGGAGGGRRSSEGRGVETRRRIREIQPVVSHGGPLGGARLAGTDREAAVHLHGVRHDNFGAKVRGEGARDGALPDARRAGQGQER